MCEHKTVVRDETSNGPIWSCTADDCAAMFLPADALLRVEQENDAVLDSVTAVFAATLWDLHERAFEARGVPHGPGGEIEDAICERVGHKMDGQGCCERCGHSPFLGGS